MLFAVNDIPLGGDLIALSINVSDFMFTLLVKILQLVVCVNGFFPDDSLDLHQYKLALFLHYYNYIKKHRGLGMDKKTPFERLNELRGSVTFIAARLINIFAKNIY